MSAATIVREARQATGMSQAALARRAGTSQATVSAYESGRKQPSVQTLDRLLAALGLRLTVEPAPRGATPPSAARLARAGRALVQVMLLAEALPTRHEPTLRYPPLARASR